MHEDSYLGEFIRFHSHHAFQESVARALERGEADWIPNYSAAEASWQRDYYTQGTHRCLRREHFAGMR